MTYGYIRVTYGRHRVHTSDIRMTCEYIRVTYGWHWGDIRMTARLWRWNMTFSDTAMMECCITQSTNIHNSRSLIRTLKYVLDILQTEEAFTVEEYKHTHTHMRLERKIKYGPHIQKGLIHIITSCIKSKKNPD